MSTKRRHPQRSPSPQYSLDDESYEPYVPISQRRQEKLAKLSSLGVASGRHKARRIQEEQEEREDALKEEERRREKARTERTLLFEAQEVQRRKAVEGMSPGSRVSHCLNPSDAKKTEGEKAEEVDQEILEAIKSRRKLVSDLELAKGIQYTDPLRARHVLCFIHVFSYFLPPNANLAGLLLDMSEKELPKNIKSCVISTIYWLKEKMYHHPSSISRYIH